MPANVGTQTVTILYNASALSGTVNRRHLSIRPTGLYSGGYLSIVDAANASLSTLICEISDGTYQVKISTGAAVTIAVAQATPYIVLRWSYTASAAADYLDYVIVATPATNDIVVGKCSFTGGGDLQGFVYAERTTPNVLDLFLKVEPTATTELKVRVRAGRVQNGKTTIQIPDQLSTLITVPSSNSRVYLVYVNRLTGAIAIDSSGTAAASPSAPSYAGKQVLAEVLVSSTDTNIAASAITDVRDFANMSYPVDDSTIQVNTDGELAVKSNVSGQAMQVIGSTAVASPLDSYAQIPQMIINMTTTGGDVSIDFDTDLQADVDNLEIQLLVDGSDVLTRVIQKRTGGVTAVSSPFHLSWLEEGLAAGAHTFLVQWRHDHPSLGAWMQYGIAASKSLRVLRAIELPHSV